MRIRTTAVLSTTTALTTWALTGCSTSSSDSTTAPASLSVTGTPSVAPTDVLPSNRLADRLLTAADLGPGYSARPAASTDSSQASVLGCEPLERLGNETGAPYAAFPHRAKAVFTGPGGTQVTEELYSAPPAKLSAGIGRIMDAMAACPTYQLATATTVAEVQTRNVPAPPLGEEQWGQIVTVTAKGRSSVIQQTVVRDGALLLVVSGTPAEVTVHAPTALAKAR